MRSETKFGVVEDKKDFMRFRKKLGTVLSNSLFGIEIHIYDLSSRRFPVNRKKYLLYDKKNHSKISFLYYEFKTNLKLNISSMNVGNSQTPIDIWKKSENWKITLNTSTQNWRNSMVMLTRELRNLPVTSTRK